MLDGLVFGWRTAILSVAITQLLVLAGALTRPIANRVANRTLAALLIVLAGVALPWAIGFAGFYDRWQWLTFVPVAVPLAVAPLIYLYVTARIAGRWPAQGWVHLAPAMGQFTFLFASFLLPMPLKDRWADFTRDGYAIVTALSVVAGLAGYGIASLTSLQRYRKLLAAQRSDDHRFAALWLSRAIGATLVLLPIWAGYAIWDQISPLGYSGLMGLYVAIAAFALFIGIEGWRHAALPVPAIDAIAAEPVQAASRDWRTQGEQWAEAVTRNRWHEDPELSLAALARLLATNTSHLSRALNEGLGVNFSSFIGRLRSETVAAAIDEGRADDLLDLALEAGFSSKASFNRAFLAAFGMTPSAYRRGVSNRE